MSKVILIRHGQSEANADKGMYKLKADYAMELTEKGKEQSKFAAKMLIEYLEGQYYPCLFVNNIYVSPFKRADQTMKIFCKELKKSKQCFFNSENIIQDVRLREQEWSGNFKEYNKKEEAERRKYSVFYYRYEGGESCTAVYDRCASFVSDLKLTLKDDNHDILIFCHGMTMRVLAMILGKHTVDEFETWDNPWNLGAYVYEFRELINEFTEHNGPTNYLKLTEKL